MLMITLNIATIFLYVSAGLNQFARLQGLRCGGKYMPLFLALCAFIIHAFLLFLWIDTPLGQNLSFVNVLSQISWTMVLLLLIFAINKPVANLGVVVYPFAALTIILVHLFPSQYIINTDASYAQLIHILLALLTVSIFFIAVVQAVFIALQHYLLRRKRSFALVNALPSLEQMETLLFQTIAVGFVLLSIILISSFMLFSHVFGAELWQHTTMAILAWCVYAILLVGRAFFGWRGMIAIRWTFIGFGLLILSFITTQIIFEMLS